MKVLITATAYPPSIGGAQLLMHHLSMELIKQHDVQVVSQWDEPRTDWLLGTTIKAPRGERTYDIDDVPVRRISLPASDRRRLLPWVLSYYALQTPALHRIAAALAEQIEPSAAGADLIHNCRIGREGLSYASLQVARGKNIPFVVTPVHHPRWSGWLHRHYLRLYRDADAVIALTEAERRTLVAHGVHESRVFVTGTGPVLAPTADGDGFRSRHRLGTGPVVLFLGQQYPYKGLATLLAAAEMVWARMPETRFVFVGPSTSYSRRLFRSVDDGRVRNLGVVDLQEKTDAVSACDVLCLPSVQESFGAVFTEAWSLGRPVVGCDIPAVRSVIDDGADGLVAEPTAPSVADRLVYLLERPALRNEMGRRGRDKVGARYTWPRLAEQTEQVYEWTLTNG